MYVCVFSHTQITLLRMFVTRQLTLTALEVANTLRFKKSELFVAENTYTLLLLAGSNALTYGPPSSCVYRTATQPARISCALPSSAMFSPTCQLAQQTVSPYAITTSCYCLRAVLYRQTYDTASLRTVVVIRYHYTVQNYHYSLRSNSEEKSSHLLRSGSL